MSTFNPGISTTLDSSSLPTPKSPVLSLVLVSSVKTTVRFPDADLMIIVAPARSVINPLTSALSPIEAKAHNDAKDSNGNAITFLFHTIVASLYRRF
jgi:hypothetical protein